MPPAEFMPVPSHFGHGSPLADRDPLPAPGTLTTASVPAQTEHAPGGRPGTGDTRDVTKQQASHTTSDDGRAARFWSVKPLPIHAAVSRPRTAAPPHR